jgi:hypothetical protein
VILLAHHAGEELLGLLAAGGAGLSFLLLAVRIRIERLIRRR